MTRRSIAHVHWHFWLLAMSAAAVGLLLHFNLLPASATTHAESAPTTTDILFDDVPRALALARAEGRGPPRRSGEERLERAGAGKASGALRHYRFAGFGVAANAGSAIVKVGDFGSTSSAFSHYSKHVKGVVLGKNGSATVKPGGPDMPEFTSFSQYRAAARDFMGGGAGPGVIERARGTDILRVDPSTGYFGVRSQDGTIRTFFRPDGDPVAYFWGLQ